MSDLISALSVVWCKDGEGTGITTSHLQNLWYYAHLKEFFHLVRSLINSVWSALNSVGTKDGPRLNSPKWPSVRILLVKFITGGGWCSSEITSL